MITDGLNPRLEPAARGRGDAEGRGGRRLLWV